MKKLICECCGGRINEKSMVCEYCGTKYVFDSVQKDIRAENKQRFAPCRVLESKVLISEEDKIRMNKDEIHRYVMRNISRRIAELIEPLLEIKSEYDYIENREVVTAKIRVVDPEYLFGDEVFRKHDS